MASLLLWLSQHLGEQFPEMTSHHQHSISLEPRNLILNNLACDPADMIGLHLVLVPSHLECPSSYHLPGHWHCHYSPPSASVVITPLLLLAHMSPQIGSHTLQAQLESKGKVMWQCLWLSQLQHHLLPQLTANTSNFPPFCMDHLIDIPPSLNWQPSQLPHFLQPTPPKYITTLALPPHKGYFLQVTCHGRINTPSPPTFSLVPSSTHPFPATGLTKEPLVLT